MTKRPGYPTSIALALAILCFAGAAQTAPRRLGLVVEGAPAALMGLVERDVAAALAKRTDVTLCRLPALKARVEGSAHFTDRRASAERRLARARRLLLLQKRPEAIKAADRAIGELRALGGRLVLPALTAQAKLVVARASMLTPTDVKRARRALGAALRADPSLPTSDLSPSLRALLPKARQGEALRYPADAIGALARLAGLDRVAWVGVRATKDGVEVTTIASNADPRSKRRELQRALANANLGAAVAEQTIDTLGLLLSVAPPPTLRAIVSSPPAASRSDEASHATPRWYQRWWVWALVGVAVAGATTATLLLIRDQGATSPPGALDIEFVF